MFVTEFLHFVKNNPDTFAAYSSSDKNLFVTKCIMSITEHININFQNLAWVMNAFQKIQPLTTKYLMTFVEEAEEIINSCEKNIHYFIDELHVNESGPSKEEIREIFNHLLNTDVTNNVLIFMFIFPLTDFII